MRGTDHPGLKALLGSKESNSKAGESNRLPDRPLITWSEPIIQPDTKQMCVEFNFIDQSIGASKAAIKRAEINI